MGGALDKGERVNTRTWSPTRVLVQWTVMVDAPPLTIHRGDPILIDPDGPPFTFGRGQGCVLVLDPTDRSISREAGRIEWTGASWVVRNSSTSRPLYVVNEVGLRHTLPVGAQETLHAGEARILVVGTRTHELRLGIAGDRLPGVGAESARDDEPAADLTFLPSITRNERMALAALAEGYLLDHPRHDPNPRTYAAAAERLSLPETTVRKRLENVRRKFVGAGVFVVEGADSRASLVEFVLAVKLITARDLAELDEPTSAGQGDPDGE